MSVSQLLDQSLFFCRPRAAFLPLRVAIAEICRQIQSGVARKFAQRPKDLDQAREKISRAGFAVAVLPTVPPGEFVDFRLEIAFTSRAPS